MCKELKIHGYGENTEASVLLDDDDYDLASKWSWKLSAPDGYPRRTVRKPDGSQTTLYLHQLLLGDTNHTDVIDHCNGDKRDYRRSNLRRCTQSENLVNRHAGTGECGVLGVYKHGPSYQADIKRNKERIFLGTFPTIEEAGEAIREYDRAHNIFHG